VGRLVRMSNEYLLNVSTVAYRTLYPPSTAYFRTVPYSCVCVCVLKGERVVNVCVCVCVCVVCFQQIL